MENVNFIACASTYLFQPTVNFEVQRNAKKERKVEPTESTNNKKKFNKNASEKANFSQHIDCII